MRELKKLAAVFLCLTLLAGVWSCRSPSGSTAGQVLDDSAITMKIKTKFLHDPYISSFSISVKTFEGQVVLTGSVDSDFAKERATAIAQTTDGVKQVNNLVVIKQQ